MGSTSTHKEAGIPVRSFFAHHFTAGTIIASGTRRNPDYMAGTIDWPYEFYAAVRFDDGHPNAGEVFAFVALYAIAPSSYYNFTYKDLDETMGPGASHAPRGVLESLTPTTHEHAREWRARCWANLELTESKPRVRRGERIRFAEPFTFAGGLQTTTDTEFEVIERDVLRVVDRGIRVRIPRWRARRYEKAGR